MAVVQVAPGGDKRGSPVCRLDAAQSGDGAGDLHGWVEFTHRAAHEVGASLAKFATQAKFAHWTEA
jgi:hypothetical protein